MTTLRHHLETLRRAQRAALAQARHAKDFSNTHPGHQEDASCCPMCAADGVPLGQLGHLVHLRCRHCGWQWSVDGQPRSGAQEAQQ